MVVLVFIFVKVLACQSCEVLPPLSRVERVVKTLVPPGESQGYCRFFEGEMIFSEGSEQGEKHTFPKSWPCQSGKVGRLWGIIRLKFIVVVDKVVQKFWKLGRNFLQKLGRDLCL